MSNPVIADEFPLILPFQFLAIPSIPTDFGRLILTASDPATVLSLLGIELGVDGGTSVGFNELQNIDGGSPTGIGDLIFDVGIPGTLGAFPFNFPFTRKRARRPAASGSSSTAGKRWAAISATESSGSV